MRRLCRSAAGGCGLLEVPLLCLCVPEGRGAECPTEALRLPRKSLALCAKLLELRRDGLLQRLVCDQQPRSSGPSLPQRIVQLATSLQDCVLGGVSSGTPGNRIPGILDHKRHMLWLQDTAPNLIASGSQGVEINGV